MESKGRAGKGLDTGSRQRRNLDSADVDSYPRLRLRQTPGKLRQGRWSMLGRLLFVSSRRGTHHSAPPHTK